MKKQLIQIKKNQIRIKPGMMTGHNYNNRVVLIDKPAGITSNDTINRIKKISGVRKIGHCGTLDRAASGLLIMCTGGYTRLSSRLIADNKEYLARVKLGSATDTDDADGEVIRESGFSHIKAGDIDSAVKKFTGELLQMPPAYSALKVKGRRASDIMRSGESVDLAPRSVHIYKIDVVDTDLDAGYITLSVLCSKGTYIRSLARDFGESLGSAAHIAALRRTASGVFKVDDAVTLEELETDDQISKRFLLTPSEALKDLNSAVVSSETAVRVLNGVVFARDEAEIEVKNGQSVYAVKDPDENLVAIADIDSDNWHVRYINVFHPK